MQLNCVIKTPSKQPQSCCVQIKPHTCKVDLQSRHPNSIVWYFTDQVIELRRYMDIMLCYHDFPVLKSHVFQFVPTIMELELPVCEIALCSCNGR